MNSKKYNYSNLNKSNYDKDPITSWGIILIDVSAICDKNINHKQTSWKNKLNNICLQNKIDLE